MSDRVYSVRAAIFAEDVASDDSWVVGVSADHSSAVCALRQRGGLLLLLDTAFDEHVCPWDLRSEADLSYEGLVNIRLRDVQGNDNKQLGKLSIGCRYIDGDGRDVKTQSVFKVTQVVREPVLSAGKVLSLGGVIPLAAEGCYMQLRSCRAPAVMMGIRFYIEPQEFLFDGITGE